MTRHARRERLIKRNLLHEIVPKTLQACPNVGDGYKLRKDEVSWAFDCYGGLYLESLEDNGLREIVFVKKSSLNY